VIASVRETSPLGEPIEVAFRFRRALEHPSYRWLTWNAAGHYEHASPPAIGQQLPALVPVSIPGL
jgi:hypothetical protein